MRTNSRYGTAGIGALAVVAAGSMTAGALMLQQGTTTQPGQTTRQPGHLGQQPGERIGQHGDKADKLAHFREAAQGLQEMKSQLEQTNQRLIQQLEQARQADDTEQKVDQLVQVVSGILNEHETMVEKMSHAHGKALIYAMKDAGLEREQIQQLAQEFPVINELMDEGRIGTGRGVPTADRPGIDRDPNRPGTQPGGPR